jgi:hypothetical protein
MAKVTGPLMSLSATGKIGGVLNFKRWGNIDCVRLFKKPVLPPDPRTADQLFYRQYFSEFVNLWQNLDSVAKNYLDGKGEEKHQSGFNFFVRVSITTRPMLCGLAYVGFSEFGDLTGV